MRVEMTDFAASRHFNNPEFSGTKIPISIGSFLDKVNSLFPTMLVDGYAPFCKHLFVKNFTGALSGVMEITSENYIHLNTGYVSRRDGELSFLTRWFDSSIVDPKPAPFLDIILYSAEHLKQEGIEVDGEWGVVSINSASSRSEDPMPPITMMRNALGVEQGGSGVSLDVKEYIKSVEFWSNHATVK